MPSGAGLRPWQHQVMPRRFDAVVFDWYATLASPASDDWFPAIEATLRASGATIDPEAFAAWLTPPTDHAVFSRDEATYRDYEERQLRDLLGSSGLDAERAEALCAEVLALRDAEEVGVYSDVVGTLDTLREAGLLVALCSNWSWDLDRHLAANAIDDRFDVTVCSAIAGYRKPHGQIFTQLLDSLGLDPHRVAFVGDDWHADVEGASAAGMFAIHLARDGCAVERHVEVPCARDLGEVAALVLP